MLTIILYGLLALFVVGDAGAHFTRYRYGPTVSWTILWLEKRYPWFHVVVAALLIVLGAHLEGAF